MGIAVGMSMLPEEFPMVLAVFMAMGAWRISKARVLTRRASAIETLGAASVLCTDKTGTLTMGTVFLDAALGPDGRTSEHVRRLGWLNATGQRLFKTIGTQASAREAQLFGSVSPEELAQLDRVVDKLIGALSGPEGAQ